MSEAPAKQTQSMSNMTAENIMTVEVFAVRPEMTVREAINLLTSRRVSGAPVVDQGQKVISVISEGDLLRLAAAAGLDKKIAMCLDKLVKTEKVVTIKKSDPVKEVYKVFLTKSVHRLPVVDGNGRLQGIVSRSNVLRIFSEQESSTSTPSST